MWRQANEAWFTFTIEGGPEFQVYAFSGKEEVNKIYEFDIELVLPRSGQDFISLLGKAACLRIADRSGDERLVHGLIRQMEQLHTGNRYTHYRCLLVPRFWFLQQNCEHRIFQHKNVLEIIDEVLQGQGFTADGYAFKCASKYPQREYTVQYAESDFFFVNRLCEEEGLQYFFEHS